jgi:hypothetical protein
LATAVSATRANNAEIDGLLGGSKWTGTITYSFPDALSDYSASYGGGNELATAGFASAPLQMQQAITYAVALVLSYTNATIQFAGTNGADIMVAQSPVANPTSYAYYPANVPAGGDIWFGTAYDYTQASLGNYYFATALHELGHAFGLKHSQETGGVANVAVPAAHDDSEFTVMSYRSYVGGPLTGYTNEAYGFSQTYMANDILALQTLYGVNYSTHSENTVYSWSPTTGQEFINGVAQPAPGGGTGGSANRIFETIWDGNGIDTYDLSNYATGVTISLNPGASSVTSTVQLAYLGNGHYAQGNIYNAYLYNNDSRSYIDNAIGGSAGDTLIGNAIANVLNGGGGDDWLTGGGGNDALIGGSGNDTAIFSGNRANYLVTYDAATQTFTLVDQRAGSPDGTDTATGVENFRFADATVASVSLAPNHAPVLTVPSANVAATAGQTIAASSLFSATDADGDALYYYLFDNTPAANSGHFAVNGTTVAAGTPYKIAAAELAQTTFVAGTAGASDDLFVIAYDGKALSGPNYTEFHVNVAGAVAVTNHAPVLTVPSANVAATAGQSIAASSLFSATDADGDALYYYLFDNTPAANSGHFAVNGTTVAAGTPYKIAAAELAQTTFVAGTAGVSDDLFVIAYDGKALSGPDYTEFHVAGAAAVTNHAPVLTVPSANVAATAAQSIAAASLFSATDADGDALYYYLFDNTPAANSGHFAVNGTTVAAGTPYKIAAAELAQTTFVAGTAGASDDLFVIAYDGKALSGTDYTEFHVNVAGAVAATNHAPVLTVPSTNVAATAGQMIAASSLFSATDADGDALFYYLFDNTPAANSGHFAVNGTTVAAGTPYKIAAAELVQTTFVAGAAGASDDLFVIAYDGQALSGTQYTEFHVFV